MSVVESMPSIPARGAVPKAIDGTLHFVLVAVPLAQGLVFAPDILNRLDAEGEIETLAVALQIVGEVAGSNADKLIGRRLGAVSR